MKKILTVALSTAMAFSMFASVAFGDTAVTPQQKFDALAAKGIFNGYPDGSAHLEKEMTRAEFAKVITKLLGLKEVTGTLSYKDKGYDAKNWAVPYIEAVTAAGIMQGQDNVKKIFNYNGKVTIQEMATVLTRALKLEIPANPNNNAADWAKGYVQAAIDKGLISKDANFKANASRSQLVEAAYAIDQATNITFTYKVVDPSNVEFTLSTGEVVKVKLDKPLEANKETEVKFKDAAGNEYTAKVTWVTTSAQTVKSAAASNLKQVVVTFDGSVDPKTAGDVDNYSISGKSFESATVSADKTSVTLLLAEDSVLTNQKEFELSINNVKNEDASKTLSQKVKFTPSDVAVPTVKEVTALGTKALKVKFSEPVSKTEALKSINYKIDGSVIAASVTYSYPDTVILTTNLTEGAHKLNVSNVTDFSGLKLVPVDYDFTATVDSAAPEIVSATTTDLTKVVVEFNEPIKRVDSAYANVSGKTPSTISISDTKVTLTFPSSSPLNYGENTVYLKGVRDYSDNSADREVKVTPSLDTTRPEVVNTSFSTNAQGEYIAKIKFSEAVKETTVADRTNYVLKNSNGDVADENGTNASGNPLVKPFLDPNANNTVVVNLGTGLSGTYSLTISNLQDTAYVPNTMLPYTATLNASQAAAGQISRVWVDSEGSTKYVYVEYNKAIATSGAGNALEAAKYSFSTSENGTYTKLTDEDSDVQPVSSDTVRIATTEAVPSNAWIKASYVANADGTYLTQNGSYDLKQQIAANVITLSSQAITDKSTVKLVFNGKLSYVNYSDFVVKALDGTTVKPNGYTLSSDNKTLYLKFDSNLPVNAENTTNPWHVETVAGSTTQDSFGNKVVITSAPLEDAVAPTVDTDTFKVAKVSATAATYEASVVVSEGVVLTIPSGLNATDLFTVKVNGATTGVTVDQASVQTDATGKQRIVVKFDYTSVLNDTDRVSLNYNANYTKALVDSGDNALAAFTAEELYRYVK